MEPRRLWEAGATETEKALLRAGREDGPREESAWEVLAAIHAVPLPPVGSGGESAVAAGGAASAKALTLMTWAKIGLLGLGLSGAAVVANHYTKSRAPSSVHPRVTPAQPAPPPAHAPSAPAVMGEPTPPSAAPPPAVPTSTRERRAGVQRSAKAPEGVPAISPVDRSLGLETRALDRAREALDGHRFAEVLRLLAAYEAAFPQGRLRPEAMIVRLDALVQSGRYATAQSLAHRLLTDDAYRAYASRIRSLQRETEK